METKRSPKFSDDSVGDSEDELSDDASADESSDDRIVDRPKKRQRIVGPRPKQTSRLCSLPSVLQEYICSFLTLQAHHRLACCCEPLLVVCRRPQSYPPEINVGAIARNLLVSSDGFHSLVQRVARCPSVSFALPLSLAILERNLLMMLSTKIATLSFGDASVGLLKAHPDVPPHTEISISKIETDTICIIAQLPIRKLIIETTDNLWHTHLNLYFRSIRVLQFTELVPEATQKTIEVIARLEKLESLTMCCGDLVTDFGPLAQMPTLTSVTLGMERSKAPLPTHLELLPFDRLHFTAGTTAKGSQRLDLIPTVRRANAYKLRLNTYQQLGLDSNTTIQLPNGHQCTELVIREAQIQRIPSNLPSVYRRLTSLSLRFDPHLQDRSGLLAALEQTRLRQLEIAVRLPRLPQEQIAHFAFEADDFYHLPRTLRRLYLEGINVGKLSHLPELESLFLAKCIASPDHLLQLATLHTLNLTDCTLAGEQNQHDLHSRLFTDIQKHTHSSSPNRVTINGLALTDLVYLPGGS